jgi:transcription elongation factor Elf1
MAETFKCPNCGALYEVWYDKAVTDDNRPAHCQVCGKEMDARNGTRILHYELVKRCRTARMFEYSCTDR